MDMKMEGIRRKEQPFAHMLKSLPRRPMQLLPALLLRQAPIGHLTEDGLDLIVAHLCISRSEVGRAYEAFSGNRRRPPNKTLMRVCTGPSCRAYSERGDGAEVTTADEEIVIEEAACCYLCGMAPVIEINGTYLGRVSEEAANEYVHNLLIRLPRADEIGCCALGNHIPIDHSCLPGTT